MPLRRTDPHKKSTFAARVLDVAISDMSKIMDGAIALKRLSIAPELFAEGHQLFPFDIDCDG
jgi:hypothetical protein